LIFTGNHELINNIGREKVIFFAKQAIKNLNFDAFKEIKALELFVDSTLKIILPSDYVNLVRLNWEKDGVLYPMWENPQIMSALSFSYDNNNHILFDENGNCVSPANSNLDTERILSSNMGLYSGSNRFYNDSLGYYVDGSWYFDRVYGSRFGLNTDSANSRPRYKIDKRNGVINFFSDMSDELVVLEYISDGMENGDETKIYANKFFEEYIYAYIEYEILSHKIGVQEYVVKRTRDKMAALRRNAEIRMNFNLDGLLMVLRGLDKALK